MGTRVGLTVCGKGGEVFPERNILVVELLQEHACSPTISSHWSSKVENAPQRQAEKSGEGSLFAPSGTKSGEILWPY